MNNFFNCYLSVNVRGSLERVVIENRYPSMMSFISEAAWLYFEFPEVFNQNDSFINLPSKQEKKAALSYNSEKYYEVTSKRFIENAKANVRSVSMEFSLFIHRINYYLQINKSLPVPNYLLNLYSEKWISDLVLKLREEKLILEFYSLCKLIAMKGENFSMDANDFCKIIFLTPNDKYDYPKRIYQKLSRVSKVSGIQFKFNYKSLPNMEIRIKLPKY